MLDELVVEELERIVEDMVASNRKLAFPSRSLAAAGRKKLSVAIHRLTRVLERIKLAVKKGDVEDEQGEQGDTVPPVRPVPGRPRRGG